MIKWLFFLRFFSVLDHSALPVMEDGLVISSALAFLAEIVNLVMILVTSLEKSDDVVDVVSDHFLRHFVGRISHRDDTLRW